TIRAELIFLRMPHFSGSKGVQINVDHDVQKMAIGLNAGGFETVHDDLTASFEPLVDALSKKRIHGSKERGELLFGTDGSGKMRMIVHKGIRMNSDPVAFLKFEKQRVIEPLGPIFLKQPVFVVALPGDVKG